jgi:hypothetical protein
MKFLQRHRCFIDTLLKAKNENTRMAQVFSSAVSAVMHHHCTFCLGQCRGRIY